VSECDEPGVWQAFQKAIKRSEVEFRL